MERREFLRTTGVSIALPFFSSLVLPGAAKAGRVGQSIPKARMVCIGNMLGFYPEAFWPGTAGKVDPTGLTVSRNFAWER
jgi:hypothetical protein